MSTNLEKHTILGVHLTDRLTEAVEVQKMFTKYGYIIKTRLGLHELQKSPHSPNGLILLEMAGPDKDIGDLVAGLSAIKGVEVKSMVFLHPADA